MMMIRKQMWWTRHERTVAAAASDSPDRGRRLLGAGLLVVGLVPFGILLPRLVHGGPGDLDPTFGGNGIVTTMVGTGVAEIRGLAVQPDGRIVAAGRAFVDDRPRFTLARYHMDGSLDHSFGNRGIATTAIGPGASAAFALVLQADGKIVLAGSAERSNGGVEFALVRYNGDGTLDLGFGVGGVVTTNIFANVAATASAALAVALQPDGLIVAAGPALFDSELDFVVVRYSSDGTLDPSFGSGGTVATDFAPEGLISPREAGGANAVAVQPDGAIVAAGFSSTGSEEFALARYESDGTLDPTFGDFGSFIFSPHLGRITTSLRGEAHALALAPGGRIIAGGFSAVFLQRSFGFDQFTLVAYLPDGALDPSFGNGGIVTTDVAPLGSRIHALALLPKRKLVAAGVATTADGEAFGLAQYHSDGALDSSFGGSGTVTTRIENQSVANTMAIQANGRIVVGGRASERPLLDSSFALARYLGDPEQTCSKGDANRDGSMTLGQGGNVPRMVAGIASSCNVNPCKADGRSEGADAHAAGCLSLAVR